MISAVRIGKVSRYSLNISILADTDSGNYKVSSDACLPPTVTSPPRTLIVQNCDKDFFFPDAEPNITSDDCGFGCVQGFRCNAAECLDGTFERICRADANWSSLVPSCRESTCGSNMLPNLIQFRGGLTHIGCNSTESVECIGGSAVCGTTIARCATDGSVTLANASFTCSTECAINDFADVAETSSPNPQCGASVNFRCRDGLFCGTPDFTRICGKGGEWTDRTHPCKRSCTEAVPWAFGLGLPGLGLCIFLICRIAIQCCHEGCCCFSGGSCCKLESDTKEKGCCSHLACIFAPVVMIAGCMKCCCNDLKTRIWTAFGVYVLTIPIILLVICIVLLAGPAYAGCCGSASMIIGIIMGFAANVLLLVFTISTFMLCTANLVGQQTKEGDKRVGPHPKSNSNDQPGETQELTTVPSVA